VVGDVVGDELGDVDGVEIDDAVGVVVVDVVRSDVVDDVVGDRVIVDPTERLDDGSDWQPRDRVLADSGCNFALYAQDSGVVLADDIDCDRVSATSVLADCDDVVRVPAVSACVCVGGGGVSPCAQNRFCVRVLDCSTQLGLCAHSNIQCAPSLMQPPSHLLMECSTCSLPV
jgi:hypothetical protein